jgi:hypothetical protein
MFYREAGLREAGFAAFAGALRAVGFADLRALGFKRTLVFFLKAALRFATFLFFAFFLPTRVCLLMD